MLEKLEFAEKLVILVLSGILVHKECQGLKDLQVQLDLKDHQDRPV